MIINPMRSLAIAALPLIAAVQIGTTTAEAKSSWSKPKAVAAKKCPRGKRPIPGGRCVKIRHASLVKSAAPKRSSWSAVSNVPRPYQRG